MYEVYLCLENFMKVDSILLDDIIIFAADRPILYFYTWVAQVQFALNINTFFLKMDPMNNPSLRTTCSLQFSWITQLLQKYTLSLNK